jgi:hypothetical protein
VGGKDTAVPDAGGDESEEIAVPCEGEAPPCPSEGLCKDKVGPAVCNAETLKWTCDFTKVEGAVPNEDGLTLKDDAACDGKDGDCDGVADDDENFSKALPVEEACGTANPGLNGVKASAGQGVCLVGKAAITWVCKKGPDDKYGFQCDFSKVLDFVPDERFDPNPEVLGKWCDSKDNDCDGEVDEPDYFKNNAGFSQTELDAMEFSSSCPQFTGLCEVSVAEGEPQEYWEVTSGVAFECNVGIFECTTDTIGPTYEEKDETRCDGLDNDCDGTVDEMPIGAILNSPCLHKGVCEGRAEAYCQTDEEAKTGTWLCVYEDELLADPAFLPEDSEAVEACIAASLAGCDAETRCDGLDNDCDGATDEGLAWPQECYQWTDEAGVAVHDCANPLCKEYLAECLQGEGEPKTLPFDNCPIVEQVEGTKGVAPVLDGEGYPILPGVCERDIALHEELFANTPAHLSCVLDATTQKKMWKCNLDDVPDFVAEEKVDAAAGKTYCDALDNDCDGAVDAHFSEGGKPTPIAVNTQSLLPQTGCRYLGECSKSGDVVAYCNKEGKTPGQWTCVYKGEDIEVPNDSYDWYEQLCKNGPDSPNCIWKESKCDGKDNDCDGSIDEQLDGLKTELATACQNQAKGVCVEELLNTVCGKDPKGNKMYLCDKSGIGTWKPEEKEPEHCDGLDNDCDGTSDENITVVLPQDHQKYKTKCLYQGACANKAYAECNKLNPVPNSANWVCKYPESFDAETYFDGLNYKEIVCDGYDNDCDGLTDEDLNTDFGIGAGEENPKVQSGCSFLGPCKLFMEWGCAKNEQDGTYQWTCDAPQYKNWGKTSEKIDDPPQNGCDGEDNDCDGQTDDPEDLWATGADGANCKSKGVCAQGGVVAACVTPQDGGNPYWLCNYKGVGGFDLNNPDHEVLCDGKDNDCDGQVDENLEQEETWKITGACDMKGVCNTPLLKANCSGAGGWVCQYGLVPDYNEDEKTNKICDGKDNDCDGKIDWLACEVCEPCATPEYCTTGFCFSEPKEVGQDKFCSQPGNCVYQDSVTNECKKVAMNTKVCLTSKQPFSCGGGGLWWMLDACDAATPICHDGTCKVCIPGKLKCQGLNIFKCNATGVGWEAAGMKCAEGQICIGEGKCVSNDPIKVNSKTIAKSGLANINPKVARRVGGGFIVVFHSDTASGGTITDVVARVYNASLVAEGTDYIINQSGIAGNQEHPDLVAIPRPEGGFVVTWDDSKATGDASGFGIMAQLVSDSGMVVGLPVLVNQTTQDQQKASSVAALYDGSVAVTWEHQVAGAGGQNSPDIYARLFKIVKKEAGEVLEPIGNEKLVNSVLTSQQQYPDIAALDPWKHGAMYGSGFVAAFTSNNQVEGLDVFFRMYSSSLTEVGNEVQANVYVASSQKYPAAAGLVSTKAGGFVVAWESYSQDSFGLGVYMNVFDSQAIPGDANDVPVNTLCLAGGQRDPDVAVTDSNTIVAVWETESAGSLGDSDADAIAAKLFNADTTPVTPDEFLVNKDTAGKQLNPAVTCTGGQAYVVVWVTIIELNPLTYDVYARMFAAP